MVNEKMKKSNKGDLQKEKLLSAARQLFAKKGYEASSTKEINHQAGASDGLLYYYFPGGKEQLLNEIIRQTTDSKASEFIIRFDKIASIGCSTEETLVNIFLMMWNLLTKKENYQVLLIMIREQAAIDREQMTWIWKLDGVIQRKIFDYLSDQFSTRTIHGNDPKTMADVISSIYESFIYCQLVLNNDTKFTDDSKERLIREIHLVLKG
ncbi:TetR/AcrR family transcriptional regulator [Oenococcus oeni]|uniref:TetR/AcrR family transcriptional regulator n=1 Tax=Oenococcus oeni TaxID=1247 RepID=UPI000277B22E|nr:TetR/AcrR family transcriptional regulator [Oenococcus oeni]KGH84191.1 TetR family transcriptional regulator [Oenococcus oeni IOEB_C28]EJO02336.1 transcriptional regulator [Oenococcus oeni AWRIB418]KGH75476.1 TetR family transcriptional regulator [Oenococcus oeni IOEB_9304]OIL49311.1 TetR family transcriptional regulator [Oenococcus oeni]OIL54520.1 TetR family transcriptional regulator [Oenococcus oeni]